VEESRTLTVTLPTDREIVMTRVFDAPRTRVFDALTKPELLTRWYGPQGWSLASCEVDLKVGGAWRFLMRRADGTKFPMHGVYREIAPPDRLIYTESYDDDFFGDLLVTTDLVEDSARTTLLSTVLHKSKEVRDANAAGVEQGAAGSFDKLAELLREMS
jgi:uncharacterized protein YndB with AHSA1/START domain